VFCFAYTPLPSGRDLNLTPARFPSYWFILWDGCVLFSTAASARRLGSITEERERIAKALEWLETLGCGIVPKLLAARSIHWNDDPHSLGGYASRRGIGGWGTAPDLFAPVQRVHFAGSETATEWRSFMEGALQSAERAVKEVLDELALANT